MKTDIGPWGSEVGFVVRARPKDESAEWLQDIDYDTYVYTMTAGSDGVVTGNIDRAFVFASFREAFEEVNCYSQAAFDEILVIPRPGVFDLLARAADLGETGLGNDFEPEWTQTPPTEEGSYWLHCDNDSRQNVPSVTWVHVNEFELGSPLTTGWGEPVSNLKGCWWKGPLPIPSAPPGCEYQVYDYGRSGRSITIDRGATLLEALGEAASDEEK